MAENAKPPVGPQYPTLRSRHNSLLLRERIAELERERDGARRDSIKSRGVNARLRTELTTLRERVKRVPHISRSGKAFWEPLLETVELQSMNQNHDAGRCAAQSGACLFIEPEPEGASDVPPVGGRENPPGQEQDRR